jgi:hypothetical protein
MKLSGIAAAMGGPSAYVGVVRGTSGGQHTEACDHWARGLTL